MNKINEIAACLDDLVSGTLSHEDTIRERQAARSHVERLYKLAEVLGHVPTALQAAADSQEYKDEADEYLVLLAALREVLE